MVNQVLNLTLSKAIEGFMLQKRGQGLSEHTLADYDNAFRKLQAYLPNDPLLRDIAPSEISAFLEYLGTTPQAVGGIVPRAPKPLSKKSRLNIHTALSALWTWGVNEGVVEAHILKRVPRPKPEKRAIVPFTKEEMLALLEACEHQAAFRRNGHIIQNERVTTLRDQTILRLLADTGIRASELCDATIRDLDLSNQRIRVYGKGSKERILAIGRRTCKVLWRYLAAREGHLPSDPLFTQHEEATKPLNRRSLHTLIARIGKRAGIVDVHPHRFRHTFAINYLRNGGDIYSLQAMLGHASLEMVREYLAIMQADVENAHRKASPIDNWGI